MRRGQAIVETLLATLVILGLSLGAFRFSRLVAARTLLDHAAARAARAKAVGFNDHMCTKVARAALIPVAGERRRPEAPGADEAARVPLYLAAEDPARANAILDYARWPSTDVSVASGSGLNPAVHATVSLPAAGRTLTGVAAIESHFPLYMDDRGR